jgi:hypothetical protein
MQLCMLCAKNKRKRTKSIIFINTRTHLEEQIVTSKVGVNSEIEHFSNYTPEDMQIVG